MVGYQGHTPGKVTRRFIESGVGGLIFFRDNFNTCQSGVEVAFLIRELYQSFPLALPKPFFGIDQEGGQVERLPHTCFPTMLTPRAVSLSERPEELAKRMYTEMAKGLVGLGFNLNFFPTLDLNLNDKNPIIGVRSFGHEVETVQALSKVALEAFTQNRLVSVGKHFPGHGNGTVDSHIDLPVLTFTEEELSVFQASIDNGLPAMLVAHGLYPALQPAEEIDRGVVSSASATVIQKLLRTQCGFDGVLITDDMCMGAITRHQSAIDAAIAALKAGVDILLYKQSTEEEWAVYEAVVDAFESGLLPREQLERSLHRILRVKKEYCAPTLPEVDAGSLIQDASEKALYFARSGLSLKTGRFPKELFAAESPVFLVHPDRAQMGNYAFDISSSPSLDDLFKSAGFLNLQSEIYPPKDLILSDALKETFTKKKQQWITRQPPAIVMVTWSPCIHTLQEQLYQHITHLYPEASVFLVAAGAPELPESMLKNTTAQITVCSYRPASMQVLASYCANQ